MKKVIVTMIAALVVASPAFALFAHPDKTPAGGVVIEQKVTGKVADVAVKNAADSIQDASDTIIEKGKATDKAVREITEAAAVINRYSKAVGENERFHFGIAGGVTYQLDNEVGVEADLYVRKQSVFMLTGVQYSPAKALKQWDNSNLRFHAVVGWEF